LFEERFSGPWTDIIPNLTHCDDRKSKIANLQLVRTILIMSLLELPHTSGCLVCGRQNPKGLHLHLHVDESTGAVETRFTPGPEHIGFEGIIHGGVLATVLDEAMVWAATWRGRRFCVCGELSIRFRKAAEVGKPLVIRASVSSARGRFLQTTGEVKDGADETLATAEGKYLALPDERHQAFMATLVDETTTARAAAILRSA
jgi:acyl-coenzyme A thioesterase PaaI-like protein